MKVFGQGFGDQGEVYAVGRRVRSRPENCRLALGSLLRVLALKPTHTAVGRSALWDFPGQLLQWGLRSGSCELGLSTEQVVLKATEPARLLPVCPCYTKT